MRLKDLAAVIASLAALVASATGLVTALRAKAEVRAVDERLYDQAATGIGENADELAQLRDRLAALEAKRIR